MRLKDYGMWWEPSHTSQFVRERQFMNSNDPAVSEALRWLSFSKMDLIMAAKAMGNPDPSPHHACWHGQQSAEKALKAALILEGIAFPYTHDLDALKRLLPENWKVHDIHDDLSDLTEWTIEARYPGAWPEPTDADAVMTESKAHAIYNSVAEEFKRRGILI